MRVGSVCHRIVDANSSGASGTAYRPENIQEKDRYPTCSIMVWVSIMINGRTRLHVVANGTMTGQRYIDEVLHPHVRLFRGAVDLNPIENVWDALGRQVAGRNYPPTNKNTLIRALTEEWDKLPQQLLDNVVQTSAHPTQEKFIEENVHIKVQKKRICIVSAKRLVFLSTGTSRTPDSQTLVPNGCPLLDGREKEKNVWSVVILLKSCSSVKRSVARP
ncbi:transposable element Tc1 transposase [Trichonephila clavipes]|nr:transposable element Tc1 transposase [Trichonephila clavipes]